MLYARMNELPLASQALKKAVNQVPKLVVSRAVYHASFRSRTESGCHRTGVELKKHYPMREEVFTILTSLYKQTGEYDKAIRALNQLERFIGINEYLTFEKFQLYTILNKEKQAVNEFNKLIAKYPKEARYKVLLGDIYLNRSIPKRLSKSISRWEKMSRIILCVCFIKLLYTQNQPDKAVESIVSALKNLRLPSEIKMEILENM